MKKIPSFIAGWLNDAISDFDRSIGYHKKLIAQSGGRYGIRDWSGLESALAQPKMTFDQRELYPSIHEKAATLAFSLIQNHPFIDGNKRVAHAVMEIFLLLNGFEIQAEVDE